MPNFSSPKIAKPKKTQQVINWVTEKIQWRVYHPDDKIPSVREMANLLQVSAFTVSQAFDSLVMQGVIYGIQGSGYYVCDSRKSPLNAHSPANSPAKNSLPPLTGNTANQLAENVAETILDTRWLMGHLFNNLPNDRASGSGLMPDDWLYPRQHMQQACKKATNNISYVYGYGHIQGYLPLREQFAVQLAEIGIHTDPQNMVTTAGVSAGIELVVQTLCEAGDYVLVDDPTWYWIIGCLQQMKLKVLGVSRRLDGGLDMDELAYLLQSYRPKVYITNSILHNPTSATVTPSEIFKVLKLMQQYDCYVLEDDIYRNFANEPNTLRYATLDNFERVFYLSGVSKVLGGNWGVGIVCSPPAHVANLLRRKMLSNMTCPEMTERCVWHIWQALTYKKFLTQVNQRLQQAHQQLRQKLTDMGLHYPAGTKANLFIWLDVGVDTSELALQAHKDGWLVAPGHLFSPTGRHKTHIRLNVTRTSDEFLAWLGNYLQQINADNAPKP